MNEELSQQAAVPRTESHEAAQRRFYGVLAALPCWIVLLMAAMLHPQEGGLGTHEQLGLPGCSWLAETGRPCPSCGLTTSMAAMAHGRPGLALRAHAFGIVLFAASVLLATAGTLQAISGRDWLRPLHLGVAWIVVAVAGLLAGWGWKLWTWPN